MATYTIGRQNGVNIRATYKHDGHLPSVTIMRGRECLGQYRGSSLGPANPSVNPSPEDIAYWRKIKHNPQPSDSSATCPACGKPTSQNALDALGQCCDCERVENMQS
jgi:hypothetical protein